MPRFAARLLGGSRARGRGRQRALSALAVLALAAGLTAVGQAALPGQGSRPPRARAAQVCPQRFGSFSAGHWPPACWRPYGGSSPFNRPLPARPRLAGESAAIARYMVSQHWSFGAWSSGRPAIPAGGGSRPVYWSHDSDPLVRVICRGGGSCLPGLHLHVPAGAKPQNAYDGHMTVVDQSAGREYDFWRASAPAHGQMTATAASSIAIGPGTGSGIGGAGEAAHLGLLGGLIRAPELAAGRIEHALATTAPCVQYQDVWPSPAKAHGDAVCAGNGAGPRFGSLLALAMSDAEIAASGAPRWQRAIMRAMAHYGIYVVDTNGPHNPELSLLEEADLSFTSFGDPGQMSRFVAQGGAAGAGMGAGAGATRLLGIPIDVSRLRVIAPCVARARC